MSSRRKLIRHRRSLDDAGKIMHSMKLLAHMESHKLVNLHAHQRARRMAVDQITAHYAEHFPGFWAQDVTGSRVCVIVGSERGFCGDFNQQLTRWIDEPGTPPIDRFILVGHQLAHAPAAPVDESLPGASVAEELPVIRDSLTAHIANLNDFGQIGVLYHDAEPGDLQFRQLLPPPTPDTGANSQTASPPLLNLSPQELLGSLLEQHVLAVLDEILHASLLAESRQRIRHLEQAGNHLEEKQAGIDQQVNALRREEIIEEIEVILLSVDALSPGAS